jgi:hypothetical protein
MFNPDEHTTSHGPVSPPQQGGNCYGNSGLRLDVSSSHVVLVIRQMLLTVVKNRHDTSHYRLCELRFD